MIYKLNCRQHHMTLKSNNLSLMNRVRLYSPAPEKEHLLKLKERLQCKKLHYNYLSLSNLLCDIIWNRKKRYWCLVQSSKHLSLIGPKGHTLLINEKLNVAWSMNSVITGKFQSKSTLIFAITLKAKRTKNTRTIIHDVTVANRKKSMSP